MVDQEPRSLGRGRGRVAALALALAIAPASAAAHTIGLSQGVYRVDGGRVILTLTLARGEARLFAPALEQDGDGTLSEVELIGGAQALDAAILQQLTIQRGDAPCPGALTRAALVDEDGLELVAEYTCPRPGDALTIDFAALRTLGRPHRHIARVIPPGSTEVRVERVLSRMRPPVTISLIADDPPPPPASARASAIDADAAREDPPAAPEPGPPGPLAPEPAGDPLGFFALGVDHILGGADHLVFLLGLLLATRRLRPLVAVITAFTVGHSLSLALALLGGWAPAPALIEPLIAASIIYVGLENLSLRTDPVKAERAARWRWRITGPFGLIHGFGFAGALAAVGLPPGERGLTLLCFNLGVEAGQLLAIGGALPLLLALDRLLAPRRWRWLVDAAVVVAGVVWLCARLGDLL